MNISTGQTSEPAGALFVIATPIGNLGDISHRAVDVLGIVDAIGCEDTRRTRRLLSAVGVEAPTLLRLDAHTEINSVAGILERLDRGERVAVVSDAGTPGISDPGARIVRACLDAEHRVVPIPGASAALAALVASGLATDRFTVEGFLPRKGGERRRRLSQIAASPITTVIYESPRRVAATLGDLAEVCGDDHSAVVARELTKLHEEINRGSLSELAQRFANDVKGECVIVVSGAAADDPADDEVLVAELNHLAGQGHSRSSAVALVAGEFGESKRRVYDLALATEWPARP